MADARWSACRRSSWRALGVGVYPLSSRASEARSSTELSEGSPAEARSAKAGRGGYGYTAQIPLKDFTPGLYVVHVEGKRRDGNVPAVARDVQIRVR